MSVKFGNDIFIIFEMPGSSYNRPFCCYSVPLLQRSLINPNYWLRFLSYRVSNNALKFFDSYNDTPYWFLNQTMILVRFSYVGFGICLFQIGVNFFFAVKVDLFSKFFAPIFNWNIKRFYIKFPTWEKPTKHHNLIKNYQHWHYWIVYMLNSRPFGCPLSHNRAT